MQGMKIKALYKYINCTSDKLLALVMVTNYMNNHSNVLIFWYKPLKTDPFQGII